jgi:glycosyltransferase involved in cell wall biosynthesis
MTQPLISLLLPGWNEGKNILRCIASLKNQTYPNFNVFMILGGDDPFIQQAKTEGWDRLIILPQTVPNKNLALNQALNHEKIGEILVLSDIDCEFPPDYLANYANDFVYGSKNVVAAGLQPYPAEKSIFNQYIQKSEEIRMQKLPEKGEYLIGANFAVRTQFLKQNYGGFDEAIKSSTDAHFRCQLQSKNEPIYFNKTNFIYTDFKTTSASKFIRQQSRWFKNVLIFSKNFHSYRSIFITLLRSLLSWLFLLILPAVFVLNLFIIQNPFLNWITIVFWLFILGFNSFLKFRILNYKAPRKIGVFMKNWLYSAYLGFVFMIIEFVGSTRALFSMDKRNSWKK